MTNMNQILATVEDTKLNLRMLSASMYDTPLRIALDRPMHQHCQAFERVRFMLATSSKLRAVINISLVLMAITATIAATGSLVSVVK